MIWPLSDNLVAGLEFKLVNIFRQITEGVEVFSSAYRSGPFVTTGGGARSAMEDGPPHSLTPRR